MKKIYSIFFISYSLLALNAQDTLTSKLELIQGIWENSRNNNSEQSFKIIKGMNSIGFSFNNSNVLNFYLVESIEGFQNQKYNDFDSLNINSFKENGEHFTTVINKKTIKNGWTKKKYCIVADYFECDGQNMSINGGQLVEYSKIDRLPGEALKMLSNRGKFDKRNYIKEYLDVDVREIKVSKSIINSNPGVVTKMYLLKSDVVTITGENADWYKIEFQGIKLVQGWIRKIDVD